MKNKMKMRVAKNACVLLLLGALLAGTVGVIPAKAAATAGDIVSVAMSQVGYTEGANNYNKYADEVGVANNQAWCATFVWWVYRTAGVPGDRYPQRTTVTRDFFSAKGLWHPRGSYTPKPGDYIAFGSNLYHCGIVVEVNGGNVVTVEGNSSDAVRRNTYSLGNSSIAGYGEVALDGTVAPSSASATTDWSNPGAPYGIPTMSVAIRARGNLTRWIQTTLNNLIGAGLDVDGIFGEATRYAVTVYQQTRGLTADGIVGTVTRETMIREWASRGAEAISPVTETTASVTETLAPIPETPAPLTPTPVTPTISPQITEKPTSTATSKTTPTNTPTTVPTDAPTVGSNAELTTAPIIKPDPTAEPTAVPSTEPTTVPIAEPTEAPISDGDLFVDPVERPEEVFDIECFVAGRGKNKHFTVTWDEEEEVDGFEIQYAKKRNSFSGKKLHTVSGMSFTVKRPRVKKYRFRIRAFNIDEKGERLYSDWETRKICLR